MQLPPFPDGYVLKAPRLNLRPPHEKDVDELWPHVTDPRLTTFLAWEPHKSKQETLGMILSLKETHIHGKGFHWIARHEKEVIGVVSLIDVRRTHRSFVWNRAELAYWTRVDHQKQGYATEASEAIVRFGFDALGFHKIIVYNATDNPSSGKVAEKLGFRPVGIEQEAFCKEGQWHDLQHYEMLHHEFAITRDKYSQLVGVSG